jgi:hypothetical protein
MVTETALMKGIRRTLIFIADMLLLRTLYLEGIQLVNIPDRVKACESLFIVLIIEDLINEFSVDVAFCL